MLLKIIAAPEKRVLLTTTEKRKFLLAIIKGGLKPRYEQYIQRVLDKTHVVHKIRDREKNSPLHFACQYAHPKLVRRLVELGHPIHVVNADGDRPIDVVGSRTNAAKSRRKKIDHYLRRLHQKTIDRRFQSKSAIEHTRSACELNNKYRSTVREAKQLAMRDIFSHLKKFDHGIEIASAFGDAAKYEYPDSDKILLTEPTAVIAKIARKLNCQPVLVKTLQQNEKEVLSGDQEQSDLAIMQNFLSTRTPRDLNHIMVALRIIVEHLGQVLILTDSCPSYSYISAAQADAELELGPVIALPVFCDNDNPGVLFYKASEYQKISKTPAFDSFKESLNEIETGLYETLVASSKNSLSDAFNDTLNHEALLEKISIFFTPTRFRYKTKKVKSIDYVQRLIVQMLEKHNFFVVKNEEIYREVMTSWQPRHDTCYSEMTCHKPETPHDIYRKEWSRFNAAHSPRSKEACATSGLGKNPIFESIRMNYIIATRQD